LAGRSAMHCNAALWQNAAQSTTQEVSGTAKLLDPIFLGARESSALTGVPFGTLAPDALTVRQTAKLRRNCPTGSRVAGIVSTVLSENP
jgi:hypothetical protein